jgi:DNA-binding transcriptional LysR family regulator
MAIAAERLGDFTTAVSKAIRVLEQTIGKRLLDRTPSGAEVKLLLDMSGRKDARSI